MAKNRNKKNKKGGVAAAMDTSEGAPSASTAVDAPEPMDTSEGKKPSSAALSSINRKIKKGVQVKRSQSVRKMKAVARAISKNEKAEEKTVKAKSKKIRVQSAKSLYD